MSLWILAIVLLLLFGGIGLALGAIRAGVSLVGMILALLFAVPFGRLLKPLLAPLGVTNPVWQVLIPPIVAFALIYLIVLGISFFIHHKIHQMYKFKRDDVDRMRWERMNRRTGVAVGFLSGVVLLLAISGAIYAGGYLTVQLSGDENPGYVKFMNSVRQDMDATGFSKVAAKFQPASPSYYETADVLGLLYHNPLLQSRLATYPYFLNLSERAEFQEIAKDKDYNDMIFGKAPVTRIIEHPSTQTIIGNSEIMGYLQGTDRADLLQYLRTGKSPKYEDQDILGVWILDKEAVVTHLRKAKPDVKSKDLKALRLIMSLLPEISLMATPDNKIILRAANATPPPQEQTEEQVAQPAVDVSRYGPEYARRMGLTTAPVVTNTPAQPAAPPVPVTSGEGRWSEEAGQYVVTITDPSGKEINGTARVQADEMVLTFPNGTSVFAKQ